MSSTNKTTYYELPQFVDNDIFNPLVDDNDAYSKIDTALHNIADAEANDASEIVSVKSRLDSAEGDIVALEAQNGNSVLTTTAQTLSGAVNELDADTSALDGRLDIVEDDINNASTGLSVKVSTLETTVGDSNSGLVKDINDAQNDITTLETTVGDSNSGLVKDVADAQSDITALETTVGDSDSGLVKDVADAQSDITALETTVGDSDSGLVKDVAGLKNKVRKFLLIGDSYMQGVNGDDNTQTLPTGGWGNRFKTKYESFGYIVDILSGGSGFNVPSPYKTWNTAFNEHIAELTEDEIKSYTDVIIIGGWNDQWSTTDLETAVVDTITNIRNNIPNARIIVAPMTVQPSQGITISSYYRYCQKAGAELNTKLINVLAQADFTGVDGIHPTANGYSYIQPYVDGVILNGNCSYRIGQTVSYKAEDNDTIDINVTASENETVFRFQSNERNGLYKTLTSTDINKSYTADATNYVQMSRLNALGGGALLFDSTGAFKYPVGVYFTSRDTVQFYSTRTGVVGDKLITDIDVHYNLDANLLPIS